MDTSWRPVTAFDCQLSIYGVFLMKQQMHSQETLSLFPGTATSSQQVTDTTSAASARPPDREQTGLAIDKLDCFVQFSLSQSTASLTQKPYSAGHKRYMYLDFCNRRQCIPHPVSENNLLLCISSQSRPDTPNYYVLFISS